MIIKDFGPIPEKSYFIYPTHSEIEEASCPTFEEIGTMHSTGISSDTIITMHIISLKRSEIITKPRPTENINFYILKDNGSTDLPEKDYTGSNYDNNSNSPTIEKYNQSYDSASPDILSFDDVSTIFTDTSFGDEIVKDVIREEYTRSPCPPIQESSTFKIDSSIWKYAPEEESYKKHETISKIPLGHSNSKSIPEICDESPKFQETRISESPKIQEIDSIQNSYPDTNSQGTSPIPELSSLQPYVTPAIQDSTPSQEIYTQQMTPQSINVTETVIQPSFNVTIASPPGFGNQPPAFPTDPLSLLCASRMLYQNAINMLPPPPTYYNPYQYSQQYSQPVFNPYTPPFYPNSMPHYQPPGFVPPGYGPKVQKPKRTKINEEVKEMNERLDKLTMNLEKLVNAGNATPEKKACNDGVEMEVKESEAKPVVHLEKLVNARNVTPEKIKKACSGGVEMELIGSEVKPLVDDSGGSECGKFLRLHGGFGC